MTNDIHPTAVIASGARLGSGNVIGPYVVVGASVVLGDRNWIGASTQLGVPPEVIGAELEPAGTRAEREDGTLLIGNDTVIRENVVISRGWASTTWLGDGCYVSAGSYVAHDCVIGSNVVLSSGVRLGGHVRVGPFANLGLGAVVHQRRLIGVGAMVGMAAVVTRDVPAFSKSYGSPAREHGWNTRILDRLAVDDRDRDEVVSALGASSALGGSADRGAEALVARKAPALSAALLSWCAAFSADQGGATGHGVSTSSSPIT